MSYIWASSKRWTDNPGDRIVIPHDFTISGTGKTDADYPAGIENVEYIWLDGVGDPVLNNADENFDVYNASASVNGKASRTMTAYLVINPTLNPDFK